MNSITRKVEEFCELMQIDVYTLKECMKSSQFSLLKCETKEEMDNEGVSYNYPYVIFDPFNLLTKK